MKPTRTATIYCIVNLVNGKKYVGQTVKKPKYRFADHFASAKCGSPMKFHIAIRQFGEQNFELRILQSDVPLDILDYTEAYYIVKYDTVLSGYNVDDGGGKQKREWCQSEQMRKAVGEWSRQWHKDNPEKSKALIAKATAVRLAMGVSDETRRKLSLARMGNTNHTGKTGYRHTEESKILMSKVTKGKKKTEVHKRAMRIGWARRRAAIEARSLKLILN